MRTLRLTASSGQRSIDQPFGGKFSEEAATGPTAPSARMRAPGLRVLQVVHKPQRRGAEIFASHLSGQLRKQGCEVRTAYLYPYEGPTPLPLVDGDVLLGGAEHHPCERLMGYHPKLLRSLSRLIADFRPDVVQANGSRTVKYTALARTFDRRPWALIYRNIGEPQRWVAGWRQGLFYRRIIIPKVSGVVSVSQATLGNVRSFYSLTAPTACIPRAVDAASFRPARSRAQVRDDLGAAEDDPVILFVGSLSPEKRLDRLTEVLARVKRELPAARLWIVGDGPERAAVEDRCAELGMSDFVQLLGLRDDVADFMHAADLLLLTSDTEGTPGVLLEASAAGLPVVATRVGGVAECVLPGRTGLLCDRDDVEGLAGATTRLLTTPTLRSRMGLRAKRWVREAFDLATVTDSYLRFYDHVLGSSGKWSKDETLVLDEIAGAS